MRFLTVHCTALRTAFKRLSTRALTKRAMPGKTDKKIIVFPLIKKSDASYYEKITAFAFVINTARERNI